MKIAVTDACIFIDLYELDLTSRFFELNIEVHTTLDVLNELFERQQELLRAYQHSNKLIIHSLSESDRERMRAGTYLAGLSENDRTVIYLATLLNALILSSDKTVRKQASKQSIEIHGMLWVFDQMLESGFIDKAQAIIKLKQLIFTNIIYQNNKELNKELDKRIIKWSK